MKKQDKTHLNTIGSKVSKALDNADAIRSEFNTFKKTIANTFKLVGSLIAVFSLSTDFIFSLLNRQYQPHIGQYQIAGFIIGMFILVKGINIGRKQDNKICLYL